MPRQKLPLSVEIRPLLDLGLSENEAVLYTLMLERAPSTVRELSTVAPFPRTLIYHVINQLERRGLLRSRKDGWRTVYVAEDPERLYDLLHTREEEIKKESATIRALIPHLKRDYMLAGKRPTVRTFEGILAYEKALDDVFTSGTKVVCAFEVLRRGKAGLESRKTHDARRALRKIRQKTLFFESAEALAELAKRPYNDYTEYRSMCDGPTPFAADASLYAGRMLYTSYYGSHEPVALLVEDRALYDMQQSFFDLLWKSGKDRTLYYTEAR